VANKPAVADKAKRAVPASAIVISLLVLILVGAFLYLDYQSRRMEPAKLVLTGAAKAYVRNLALMEVEMKAHESYLKQQVVEITGKIGNNGDRVLNTVQINCVFYDSYGQVVLREAVPIVSAKMGKLAPGEIKNFRLAFDNIPASWNQSMPQLVIAQIIFA
jgi:hypothetical protein